MGRTKLESIELDDEVKPENSHVARTVVEDNEGEEPAILRHSLPYGDGRGDQGLFFIAYTNDLSIIDSMSPRQLFGTSGDGIHDRLLHFVTPMDGAYYWCQAKTAGRSFGRLNRRGSGPFSISANQAPTS